MLTQSPATYIAAETIPAGARVKFVSGSSMRVELADAADVEIGTALLYNGKSSYAADTEVGVQLISDGTRTRTCIALSAIAVGATVQRAIDGKVDDAGAGDNFGIALDSAAADGDTLEVLSLPYLLTTLSSSLASSADGLGVTRIARATFNPSATSGERTIGAHTLGITVPDKAIVTRFWYEVNTTFTSATDAATVAFSLEAADDLLAAIAISNATNVLDAGLHAGKPGLPNLGADAAHDSQVEVAALIAATLVKTTAARLITATVAVEALTAGKATLFLEYVQGA